MTKTKVKIKRISNYPFGNGPRPVEYRRQGSTGINPRYKKEAPVKEIKFKKIKG